MGFTCGLYRCASKQPPNIRRESLHPLTGLQFKKLSLAIRSSTDNRASHSSFQWPSFDFESRFRVAC